MEDQLVDWFKSQARLDPTRFPIGIGDDMAQINLPSGGSVLVTTDMLLSGVHFDLSRHSLDQVGYKAMACSLSDCAAMASRPVAAVVAVGLPAGSDPDQLKLLHRGILKAAQTYDFPLVGGDMTVWRQEDLLAICVAMISIPGPYGVIRRSGAVVGDMICVTGRLGGSIHGRHMEFVPRVNEAIKLAGMVRIHAMMDLSDGLASDLPRLCKESKVGAVVNATALPISDQARLSADPIASALCDGEDFELLFTISQTDAAALARSWDDPLPITCIGQITAGSDIKIILPSGTIRDLDLRGYDHFERK
ncbi:MAG: thiamine-phosphate kinase [Sedimentisphaerales bacterium]|nr:thiamine-phosphate kinase [Sedimentisphaerales bacterium]